MSDEIELDVRVREIAKKIQARCPELIARSWKPILSDKKPASASSASSRPSILASKFGGTSPWTPPGDKTWKWPLCGECGEPKTFFCQFYIKVIRC